MGVLTETKTCNACHLSLPLADFHRSTSTKDRRRGDCRYCRNSDSKYAERRKAYQAAWRIANKERAAAYKRTRRKTHPGEHAEGERRRNARKAGSLVIPIRQDQLADRMAYWGNRCWMCGGPFEHVDHVKPLAKGGPHVLANLRPACAPCNSGKNARWPL